ncbi:MAG TPA: hypothetical protein VK508_00420 [Cyclobacteriaceae bacterium]|nr:hypothetical protein [Cyclobacteriaceae bacterium]
MRPLFEEKQRFSQWWLWTIIVSASAIVLGIFGHALYIQLVLGQQWGDKPISNDTLIMLSLFNATAVIVMLLVFFNAMLEVVVDKSSVSWRFFPLFRKWRRIERENILDFGTRKYYMKGYGFHRDLRGNKRITVKGHDGIEITLTNGSKLMLGTQQPGEFLSAIEKMKHRSAD